VNIRPKVAALTAGIFLVLGIAEILVEKQVVMPSFAELERANARVGMRRINFALDLVIDRIAVSTNDWGNWADTYRFAQDHNPDFITTGITNVALRQLNVNVMLIVDPDGGVVASKSLDLKSDRQLGLDLADRKALPIDFPWRANLHDGRPARGLLKTNLGTLMLAIAPVLDGNGGGPVRGAAAFSLRREEHRRPGAGRPVAARAGSDPGAGATHRE
jgi:sensor domain CHASE-containing protein